MSENTPENEQPGTNDGHPAWQEILNVIPDPALQELLKPKLQEWDNGVQQKLQQVREPYSQYQELVDNQVDPEQVKQALYIAHLLNTDPNQVVSRAIESFGLDYVPKSQVPSTPQVNSDPDEDYDFEDGSDITKHPAFVALQQQLEQVTGTITQQQEQDEYERQDQEWKAHLKSLHDNPEIGDFDDDYVTALVANGASTEAAIESFQNRVKSYAEKAYPNQQPSQQQVTPPAVMSGNAGIGTGTPANDIRMGDLNKGQVSDVAAEFLAKALASGQ